MSTIEERLVEALDARADAVTAADLRPGAAPTSPQSAVWTAVVVAAAGLAASAAVVATISAVEAGGRSSDPDTVAASTTEPDSDLTPSSPPTGAPSPSADPPSPSPTASAPAEPSATLPPEVRPPVRAQPVLGLVLDVPVDWRLDAEDDGHSACLGPAGDECAGIEVMAAGETVTVDSYFDSPCTSSGPTPVRLDSRPATYGTFGGGDPSGDCGFVYHLWVLDEDPFWSVGVRASEVSEAQARAVASVRFPEAARS